MSQGQWGPDPTGRHEARYFDGRAWTDHVSDAGAQALDPLPPAPQPVAKQRKRDDRAARAQAKGQQKQQAAFAASAAGAAMAAYERGDRFFQWLGELQASRTSYLGVQPRWGGTGAEDSHTTHNDLTGDLSSIEAAGWRLESMSHFFMPTGETSRHKLVASGEQSTITGKVLGVYLFRRVEGE